MADHFWKWLALVSQSLLLATAVMPYIVLRDFFGGMNVIAELVLLFVVIGLSGLLTALMVGLSVVSNFLIRCFFTVPVLIMTISFMTASIALVTGGNGILPFNLGGWGWLAIVPAAIFLSYYLLAMAASRIAPQAVNYVTSRRVAGLNRVYRIRGSCPSATDLPVISSSRSSFSRCWARRLERASRDGELDLRSVPPECVDPGRSE